MRAAILALAAVIALAGVARAQESPRAQWSLGRGSQPYAGVAFYLDLVVEGFDEQPAPVQPKLEIPGAKVAPVSVTPNTSTSIQIFNGRRVDTVSVTWVMRYRVLVEKAGRIMVPQLAVKQGSKQATAQAGAAEVQAVPDTSDMKVALELPQRPVYVGESLPVKLTWLFRRQPSQDPLFNAPLLGLDAFTISAQPPADPRKAVPVTGGQKDLALAYTVDRATVDGVEYTRLEAAFLVAPRTVGKIEIPPTTVLAALPVGRADFFGNAPSRMFRATDAARTLEVRPLPETNRPPTFAGAVGEQFAIDVRTSRSVVKLGEPVELDIKVKSNQRLDTLSLGRLDGEGRLPKDKFTAPAESPTGELSEDGTTKTFKVVAQVIGPATEVPALAFSYFDPTRNAYQTIRSEPIALSVGGSSVVGAGDVIGGAPAKRPAAAAPAEDTASVNAELALSSTSAVDDRPLSGALLWMLVGLLYAVPLGVLGFRSWQLRTAGHREEAAEQRAARRRVEELLDRGASAPAREIAGPLAAALRELARVVGRGASGGELDDNGLLARLETESFAPEAASRPLSADLRSDAAGLLRRWTHAARRGPNRTGPAAAALVVTGLAALGAPATARADALGEGRMHYQQAMTITDPTVRKAAFARAAVALGEAAHAQPDRPELLADWGNAALGAGDVATATLAYRRALAIDAGNPRARRNLGWLRGRQGDLFRPETHAGATDTLLFFHAWPRARRLLVGAGAFAVAILLLVPWSGRRRRGRAAAAVLPLAVWLAMLASVVLEDRH
ncbi:MAG TPA: BatD family protein, partial [Kofleriaceae bacterium]|nr:BatD family protein [Kofleriaceae bacterium]